jgi:hypothetical protein
MVLTGGADLPPANAALIAARFERPVMTIEKLNFATSARAYWCENPPKITGLHLAKAGMRT